MPLFSIPELMEEGGVICDSNQNNHSFHNDN